MIHVDRLKFSYSKKQPLINDISFDVTEGEIFGFLGPSGAGKSTLQKILCGILRRYSGRVHILGSEVKMRDPSFYEQIGVDFEFPNFYGKFTARENLEYFTSFYKVPMKDIDYYLQRFELIEHADKKVSKFSKGMKMRLSFIRSILHRPKLLFLDEPTSGLDPSYARLVKDMIIEQKNKGTTIIITTHNMHDADELCDRVAFIVDGDIVALDAPQQFKQTQNDVMVKYTYQSNDTIAGNASSMALLSRDLQFIEALNHGNLRSIHSQEPTLEDAFINLTGRRLV